MATTYIVLIIIGIVLLSIIIWYISTINKPNIIAK